jgi:hypothetical protein
MKDFKFKPFSELTGIDLTTIAYAIAMLLGLCCDVSLTTTFLIASALCTYVACKKSEVALTILNALLTIYITSQAWGEAVRAVTDWWNGVGVWWTETTSGWLDQLATILWPF